MTWKYYGDERIKYTWKLMLIDCSGTNFQRSRLSSWFMDGHFHFTENDFSKMRKCIVYHWTEVRMSFGIMLRNIEKGFSLGKSEWASCYWMFLCIRLFNIECNRDLLTFGSLHMFVDECRYKKPKPYVSKINFVLDNNMNRVHHVRHKAFPPLNTCCIYIIDIEP